MKRDLEDILGLHEEILIIYVVTGYKATFSTMDGQRDIASAEGKSVVEAIENLKKELVRIGNIKEVE